MADWNKITSRGDVEDRRGMAPAAIGGVSLTGLALLFVVNYLSGGTMGDFLQEVSQLPVQEVQMQSPDTSVYEGQDSYEVFASRVLGSNNEYWTNNLAKEGIAYTSPKLVLFRQATDSGCGGALSEQGPHYCPNDQTIYLDETFFEELSSRFGAKGGDVAQAYVMAHEVGHHVQHELGAIDFSARDNETSVKIELQADCYAGAWANSIKNNGILEKGEIGEAMDAAAAVGDDRIQKEATGQVNPETWTHGSSQERLMWFTKGYDTGTLESCDTFR